MIAYLVTVFPYKQLAVAFTFAQSVVTKGQTKPSRAHWHGPWNESLAMCQRHGESEQNGQHCATVEKVALHSVASGG